MKQFRLRRAVWLRPIGVLRTIQLDGPAVTANVPVKHALLYAWSLAIQSAWREHGAIFNNVRIVSACSVPSDGSGRHPASVERGSTEASPFRRHHIRLHCSGGRYYQLLHLQRNQRRLGCIMVSLSWHVVISSSAKACGLNEMLSLDVA